MQMLSIIGLGVMLLLWLATLRTLAWSWQRHIPVAIAAGIEVDGEFRGLTSSQVIWRNVQRHTWGWTAFFFGFFLLLDIADFPTWQRLGIAVVLSAYWGIIRVQQDEKGGQESEPRRDILFGPVKDQVWYRGLAVGEWFGYLGLIVFASQILAEAFGA
jgi:hypothetical protein